MLPRPKALRGLTSREIASDILGCALVFALPVIVLAIGAMLDGGL